jgi:DNA-binding winged helix-turn-helix (wHTH) protein
VLNGAHLYRFDDIAVQPNAFRVEKSGSVVALEPKSFRLLLYLIEHRDRAVSKDELLREIWEDMAVTDNALTRVMAQLRKALGDDAKETRYIETIPTLGYRFVAEVAVIESPQSGPTKPAASVVGQRRTSRAWITAAMIAVAIVGAFAGIWWQRNRTVDPPQWSGALLGGSIIASHPRISPDGQLLAFRAIVEGQSQVAVMKPDAASWTIITNDRTRGAVASVAWAWDNSKIYFDREWESGTIYSIAPLGGEPRALLDNAWKPEPLPDGSLIVQRPSSNGSDQLLHFWPDSGRLEALPVTVQSSDTRTVAAFPDGKEIAVLGYTGAKATARHVFTLDLATKGTRDLSPPNQFVTGRAPGFESNLAETISTTSDGKGVIAQMNEDDNKVLAKLPRDGSKRVRALMRFPVGATPLSFDAGADGSIYMDHSAFDTSIATIAPGGHIVSEMAVPMGAGGAMPLSDGRFVITLTRGGQSQLLVVAQGADPRPLLNTTEPARLPGVSLGNGRFAFLIGPVGNVRLAIGSMSDGRVLKRFETDVEFATSVAASPDAQVIYYALDGVIWAQPAAGGAPKKIGEGYDVAAGPSGRELYAMRSDSAGYGLWYLPLDGSAAAKVAIPPGFNLTPNRLPARAVNRDGRILLAVTVLSRFFYQVAVLDPARHAMTLVPTPPGIVCNNAGWAEDGSIYAQFTKWSSTLWRYRMSLMRKDMM